MSENYRKYSVAQFEKAIKGSGGIVTTIAKRLGCAFNTAKKYIEENEEIRILYNNEIESTADLAESILIKSIQGGNTQDAKWWLSRIRRDRFGDNLDLTIREPVKVQIIFDDDEN